ncbi:UDP-2,3-diacylglucosamine diphosphatase [Roseateles sp. BYS180W]|uniref:UDP-2,3-diacylglucosamine hydrolase n=1 Tax=Roseateles rivi TaxID=3299028 RepID=A0ABW7FVA8_9BURK
MQTAALPSLGQPLSMLDAAPQWRSIEFVSDLHLCPEMPQTLHSFERYLAHSEADALFLLGDVFEAWVGDDARLEPGFEAQCCALLKQAAARRALYFMHGNRDFLLGPDMARDCQMTLLNDPVVLQAFGQRWLISHGDALCLEDQAYQQARLQLRSPAWQQQVLAQPLPARRALAQQMRAQSRAHQAKPENWADVDNAAAALWLTESGCATLIHGHTHRPGTVELGAGQKRVVLSDWEPSATPPRGDVLRLTAQGLERLALDFSVPA